MPDVRTHWWGDEDVADVVRRMHAAGFDSVDTEPFDCGASIGVMGHYQGRHYAARAGSQSELALVPQLLASRAQKNA